MKKLISIILVFSLLLALSGCGGTGNKSYDYILELLENEDYDMAIHVIEGLKANSSGTQATGAPSSGSLDQTFQTAPESTGSDWIFRMDLINYTAQPLTLESLILTDYLRGQELGRYEFHGEDLQRLPMGQLVLAPSEGSGWDDGHPVTADFDSRIYDHIFSSADGQTVHITYIFDMSGMEAAESAGQPTGDWVFPILLENTGSGPWTLRSMDITNFMNDQQLGAFIFQDEDLEPIGLGGLVLEPGQQMNWTDGYPATAEWNAREYRFHFTDEQGQPQVLSFRFDNLQEQNRTVDYSQDQGKDLKTLRHEASFQQEVYEGVYWVPAVTLGTSRYTNMDIHQMLSASPEDKQRNISTLYEALQLYQVGNFTPSDDNIRIFDNGINWEHHKPGYHAVRTNTGCCATDSNWLHYILYGDYEEVGYFATSQRDGSGHVYNYILHEGWYYIVDLTHYHASGSIMDSAEENGDLSSYRATDFILGNIHKTRNIQNYVDYVQATFYDPPGLMLMYTAENVLAVDGSRSDRGVQIIYENAANVDIRVVFDDPSDSMEFVRAESPTNLPDWNR